jgi:hypothetical protein
MDDIVKRAMAKWPNVPDCFGWLGLDRRGQWFLRDESAQAKGPFPLSKGDALLHAGLIEFIGRNYARHESGAWCFQNGPQRVFVELECTPFVWRLQKHAQSNWSVHSHTGTQAQVRHVFLDEKGLLYLDTHLGFGLVHSLDMWTAGELIDEGLWEPTPVLSEELPKRFAFIQSPIRMGQ